LPRKKMGDLASASPQASKQQIPPRDEAALRNDNRIAW
jgi:hypothetical protein